MYKFHGICGTNYSGGQPSDSAEAFPTFFMEQGFRARHA